MNDIVKDIDAYLKHYVESPLSPAPVYSLLVRAREELTTINTNNIRTEYIARLIEGVREQIDNDTNNIKMRKGYTGVISGQWCDAALLCDAVERDVLNDD